APLSSPCNKYLSSLEIAVTMIAIIWLVFGLDLRIETNSNPLILGIWTSTKAIEMSSFQQIFNASLGSVEEIRLTWSTSSNNALKLMIFSSLSSRSKMLIVFILAIMLIG